MQAVSATLQIKHATLPFRPLTRTDNDEPDTMAREDFSEWETYMNAAFFLQTLQ